MHVVVNHDDDDDNDDNNGRDESVTTVLLMEKWLSHTKDVSMSALSEASNECSALLALSTGVDALLS